MRVLKVKEVDWLYPRLAKIREEAMWGQVNRDERVIIVAE
jgi:hypothetical protein